MNDNHTCRRKSVTISAERPFASTPCLHPPDGLPHLTDGSPQGVIDDGGVGLVIRSQYDLIHVWHASEVSRSSSSFQSIAGRPQRSHPMAILHFIVSSAIIINDCASWFWQLATLNQSTFLSSNCRLQRQYSPCQDLS